MRDIVKKQIETGLDVIDDGEQSRESFVLYMRRRLTGLGGEGSRPMHSDLDAYPQYKASFQQRATTGDRVSNRANLPKAIGAIGYSDPSLIEAECADFRAALSGQTGYTDAFLTAPSPGIIASIVQNEHYDSFERYLDALSAALQVEYEAIVRNGFLLQLDCPDLALERHTSYRDRPLADFVKFVETVVAAINKATANIPREKIRLHVCWGNYEGPHDHDVALRDILPAILKAKAGAIFLPFANPRHAHEFRVLKEIPLARRSAHHRGRDRHADQFRRAPGGRCRPHRAHRGRHRRSAPCHRWHRLRLRHLGRHGARHRGCRLGEAARAARRREDRERTAVQELTHVSSCGSAPRSPGRDRSRGPAPAAPSPCRSPA